MLVKLRDLFFQWKLYFLRGSSYLSLINTGMILIILLIQLKDKGIIDLDISRYIVYLYFGGVAVLTLIGWIEIKIVKGIQKEARLGFGLNPDFVAMKKMVEEIHANHYPK